MMGQKKRRDFRRPLGERRYRKMFVIAVEGSKTEPQYFNIFKNRESIIHITCLKGKHDSSPPQVRKRMEAYLKAESLRSNDEAWLVVDKDQWDDHQLNDLHQWATRQPNYGFGLSNPNFEFWILLHFEDGNGVTSSQDCSRKLKNYLPEYDKGIDSRKFTGNMILEAIERAKRKDSPPCSKWPSNPGTTIYRLIEKIIKPP